ncbi:MAG: apolipoprotein N-acyltransferase [Bacteroidota bacterium]
MTTIAENTVHAELRRSNLLLAVSTGLLLGFAFPPSPFYSFAYLGLVPFLFLLVRLETVGSVLRYSYLSMGVFNLITLYWVGGFTHMRDPYLMISGGLLLLLHPMFYWLPILGGFVILRRWGEKAFLAAFPFLWVGFEFSHSLGEFSFPWLTLGNSQAYDTNRIQIIEFTSVYGLSMLVLIFNVLAFIVIRNLTNRAWKPLSRHSVLTVSLLMVLYLLPLIYGVVRRDSFASDGGSPVKVGIVQPNIDPFEKWGEGFDSQWESFARQLRILYEETRRLSADSLDVVLWPETAIPFYILLPQNAEFYNQLKHEVDLGGTPVFTGVPDGLYLDSAHATPTSKWIPAAGMFFEGYNAATLFKPYEGSGRVYHKVNLVPFAERVPHAETLTFLIEAVRWSVGLGSWGKGTERILFNLPTRSKDSVLFAGMICYELIFPGYVRQLVEDGAEFLVVLSNDSWWGNTSGARQLSATSILRAVETRRWVVRCANGGISGIIDPSGQMVQETGMFESATVSGMIRAQQGETFYVRHGDIVGWMSLIGGLFAIAAAFVIPRRKGKGIQP